MNYRDTILEVNMDNCFHNINLIKELNPNKKIIAVVKANAYGHGIRGFSSILEKYNKVDYFAVATLDEAIYLRMNGIKKDILVLGVTDKSYFNIALEYNIIITCYSLKCAYDIYEFNKSLRVHIKIDTGMNRIGLVGSKQVNEAISLIDSSQSSLEGIFTQLSSADTDKEYTDFQIENFKKCYFIIKNRNIEVHVQNTAGIINNKNLNFVTAIRPGLVLYGHNCTNYKKDKTFSELLDFKELITLKSKITMIKAVEANSKIGYNGDYINKDTVKIATLPIGYADGYKMIYKNLYAIKNNNKYKIRGKVCMDQLLVEVDDSIKEGDYIFLINNNLNANFIATKTYISIYELLTSLSARLYREFYLNGKLVAYESIIDFKVL